MSNETNSIQGATVLPFTGTHKGGNTSGGDGGNIDPMEARVAKLEAIVPTLATKEDLLRLEVKLHQEINAQTWRIIGAMITFGGLLCAAVFFIARNVK